MTARGDDLPVVLNLQSKLLVPHLSFNAIGFRPAILPFRAINAPHRRRESSYPRSSSRRAEAPKAAVACRCRSRASRANGYPCLSAMSHTVKLSMNYVLYSATIRLEGPAQTAPRAGPLALSTFASATSSSPQPHTRLPYRPFASLLFLPSPPSRLRSRYADCVPPASPIPLLLELGAALRRAARPPARAEHLVPAGEAAVRVHESLSRILIQRCACLALSVENRELFSHSDSRRTSAQAREAQNEGAGAALRAHVSSFLGLSIAIFLDLCDTARSHADSAARTPEHAGNHAREVALEVGPAAVPLYDGGRLRTYHPSNSMPRLPGRNLAQPTSVAVDDRPRMALALSLDNTAAASPLALAFGVALLGDPQAPAATAVRRRGRLPRTARCPRASTIAPCVSPASPSPIVAPRVPGRGEALPFVDALAHDRRRCSFPLASPADAAVRPRARLDYARSILTAAAAADDQDSYHFRCAAHRVGGSSSPSAAVCAHFGSTMSSCPSTFAAVCAHGGGRTTMPRDSPPLFDDDCVCFALNVEDDFCIDRSPSARGPTRRFYRPWARTSAGEDVLVAAVHHVLVDADNVLSPRSPPHPFRRRRRENRLETVEVEEPYKLKIISQNSKTAEALLQRSSAFEGEGGPAPASGQGSIMTSASSRGLNAQADKSSVRSQSAIDGGSGCVSFPMPCGHATANGRGRGGGCGGVGGPGSVRGVPSPVEALQRTRDLGNGRAPCAQTCLQQRRFNSRRRGGPEVLTPALERGGKTYVAGLWADGASREAVLFQKLQDGSQFVQGLLQIQYPKSKTTRRMLISDASNVV
ncbi:hypothetical protein C8R45DRAFT_948068 [Mycena sanguinolenta]|nr:hypothetical protein C8R45DRAFT_948068 [Mycena sanguinolenta]